MQSKSDHRRPETLPGRRFVLMAAATAAALALGVAATPASADLNVVSALTYTGTQGNPSSQTVPLSKLQTCPPYAGPTSITLQPGGQPVGVPLDSSWTLETVLECGLSIQPSDVVNLTVINGGTGADESTLNSAQLSAPSRYPGGGGALPTVSVLNETIGQIQYARPWLGTGDNNAADQFTLQPNQGQPPQAVSIVVFETQPPLVLAPRAQAVAGSLTAGSEKYTLSATVATAGGVSVPSADLSWSWSVNGVPVSSQATPTVSLPTSSVNPVSVQVSDATTGTGGTRTFDVTVPAGSKPPPGNPKPGAGKKHNGNPTGNHNGNPKSRGNSAPKRSHHQKPTTTHPTHKQPRARPGTAHDQRASQHPSTPPPATTPPATTPPAATPPSPPETPPPAAPTTTPGFTPVNGATKPPRRRHHHATAKHPHPGRSRSRHHASGADAGGAAPQVVTGRLVAALDTAPASSSPPHRSCTRPPPARACRPGCTGRWRWWRCSPAASRTSGTRAAAVACIAEAPPGPMTSP
jgi:hypothetical protein